MIGGAILIWKRGLVFSFKERLVLIKNRFYGPLKLTLFLSFMSFIGMGFTIYYNEHFISKTFYTQEDEDQVLALNEIRYGHLARLIQPKITKARIEMEVFPSTRDFRASGELLFVNKVEQPIDTILLAKSFKEITSYQIANPHQIITIDEELHFDIIKLDQALEMGDTLYLNVEVKNHPNSLLHDNSRVLTNGTFITSNILPVLGVRKVFLTGKKKREKYGLDERKVKAAIPTDSTMLGYEFSGNNMDLIDYETMLSTSSDQQGFSMGTLINQWNEKGRNYFQFKSEGKIPNNISWFSGVYDKKEKATKHQHLEFYHHADHHQNNAHFFHGLKSSLDYCSDWFGPLQYDTLKLVEFPISMVLMLPSTEI